MGERTSYETGSFSWIDLATTDQEAAKAFYAGLFGWEFQDNPIDDSGAVYTICRLDGKDVAAIAPQREDERNMGVPPHWNSYITAQDIDDRAPRVSELGGNVMMEPFDVMDVGRMAVAQDPTGAFFFMWKPKRHIGAGLVNTAGALVWNELGTKDVEKARTFYADLFGWTYDAMDMGDGATYYVIRQGERSNGGIRPQSEMEKDVPPNWLVYFGAENCDESAAQAQKLGAQVVVPGMDLPQGRFAILADPQGAVFALFQGDFDD